MAQIVHGRLISPREAALGRSADGAKAEADARQARRTAARNIFSAGCEFAPQKITMVSQNQSGWAGTNYRPPTDPEHGFTPVPVVVDVKKKGRLPRSMQLPWNVMYHLIIQVTQSESLETGLGSTT